MPDSSLPPLRLSMPTTKLQKVALGDQRVGQVLRQPRLPQSRQHYCQYQPMTGRSFARSVFLFLEQGRRQPFQASFAGRYRHRPAIGIETMRDKRGQRSVEMPMIGAEGGAGVMAMREAVDKVMPANDVERCRE